MDTFKEYQVIPFTYDAKQYQIRVLCNHKTIYVRAFYDDKPANGYEYRLVLPAGFKLTPEPIDAITHLIESAKSDITFRRWERLIEAMNGVNKVTMKTPTKDLPRKILINIP